MDVEAIRKLLDMDRKEFAKAIGVDQSVLSRYESGKVKPPQKRVERMEYLLFVKGYDKPGLVIEHTKSDENIYRENLVNEYARRLIIQGANGHCELCGKEAPFKDKEGRPYLCLHEIEEDNNIDVTRRFVALCPDCNAKVNVLSDASDIEKLKNIASLHIY